MMLCDKTLKSSSIVINYDGSEFYYLYLIRLFNFQATLQKEIQIFIEV